MPRNRNPLLGTTPIPHHNQDILDIGQVAALLRCSVDTVRRIPRGDLAPRRGPGRSNLYLREDLVDYLRRRPARTSGSSDLKGSSCNPLQLTNTIDFASERRSLKKLARDNGK